MKRILYALIVLFLIFCVTDYNSRLEKQYTFADDKAKQDFLETMIVNETDSDESVSTVISELMLLPDDVWKDYFKNGGQVIITKNFPVEDVVGTFSVKKLGHYIIYISPYYVKYAMLHEIGHYIEFIKSIEKDSDFIDCLSEKEKALNGVLNNSSYFEDNFEYFAEMFKLYFHNQLDPAEYPLTTTYIESLLPD